MLLFEFMSVVELLRYKKMLIPIAFNTSMNVCFNAFQMLPKKEMILILLLSLK